MRRQLPGLSQATSPDELPAGQYLVEVFRCQYRWHKQKPFYSLFFRVLGPPSNVGAQIQGRLYCTIKALWKLSWFLKDFGYAVDLLDRNEIDEKALIGLRGIVRISYTSFLTGHRFLNLEGFAPEVCWEQVRDSKERLSIEDVA